MVIIHTWHWDPVRRIHYAIVSKPLDPAVLQGRRKLRATDFNQWIVERQTL